MDLAHLCGQKIWLGTLASELLQEKGRNLLNRANE
jgi:hypothetical protein